MFFKRLARYRIEALSLITGDMKDALRNAREKVGNNIKATKVEHSSKKVSLDQIKIDRDLFQ